MGNGTPGALAPLGTYTLENEKKLKPGLYLGLLHGRHCKHAVMEDWGFDGPIVGPLNYVHTTYVSNVKYTFTNPDDAAAFGVEPDGILFFDDDMLKWGPDWYGDWTVFCIPRED